MQHPFAIAVTFALLASTAQAKPPLIQVNELVQPLVEARAANVVRKGCEAYSVNVIRAYRDANALKNRAVKMGYSKSEVDAFIDDKVAKAHVKTRADALLAELGYRGDSASLCAAGDRLVQWSAVANRLISR